MWGRALAFVAIVGGLVYVYVKTRPKPSGGMSDLKAKPGESAQSAEDRYFGQALEAMLKDEDVLAYLAEEGRTPDQFRASSTTTWQTEGPRNLAEMGGEVRIARRDPDIGAAGKSAMRDFTEMVRARVERYSKQGGIVGTMYVHIDAGRDAEAEKLLLTIAEHMPLT